MEEASHQSETPPPNTPDLLSSFEAGDESAYEVLFQRYRLRLLGFISKHLHEPLAGQLTADDVLQETHLAAVGALDRFVYRRELSFFLWLCGIAIRRIRNHWRKVSRRPLPASLSLRAVVGCPSSQEVIETLRCGARSPEDELLLVEQVDVLATALERLPAIHREALLLRYIEGEDNAGAALRAGVPEATFRPRVHRGLRQLRSVLDELLGPADRT